MPNPLVTLTWTWNHAKHAYRGASDAIQRDIDAPDFDLALPVRA
jgi:hypothetical protein